MAVMNTANYLAMTVLALLLFGLARGHIVSAAGQLGLLAVLAGVGALAAGRLLLRESLEQLIEIALWPSYRVHTHGPGCGQVPRSGPVVIIANHTAWFDPIWLGKVIPRFLIPMMTSRYYDRPVLRWLMRKVVGAIRVPAGTFRREAPELQEAVAALDRGECLIIFPEGAMRRKPDQSLRHFGQGIWRILSQRPDTPVVVCWIEGGWGSFASYAGGPPTKNKSVDWWRRIDIAIEPPQRLPADVLADQRATRTYLMRACLEARRWLGLEPLPLPSLLEAATGEEME
jgi:1-acyl-sn-glycerol-3-phosphate acyltransferase